MDHPPPTSPSQTHRYERDSTHSAYTHDIKEHRPRPTYFDPPYPPPPTHFDPLHKIIPPKKRYPRLHPRTVDFLVGALHLILIIGLLVGLGVGLGVGLSPREQPPPEIPLPDYRGINFANVTFYKEEPGLDLCGNERLDRFNSLNVAMSGVLWDAAQATSNTTLCGKHIRVSQRQKYENGAVGTAMWRLRVVDRCEECGPRDLAIPIGVLNGARLVEGEERAEVEWQWSNW